MTREIKFRGQRLDNKEWVYGLPSLNARNYAIRWKDDGIFHSPSVDRETVGQFTRLRDKNGKEVYEGDIVHCQIRSADGTHNLDDYVATVEDDVCNPCFVLKRVDGFIEYDFVQCGLMVLEVTGTIHDKEAK